MSLQHRDVATSGATTEDCKGLEWMSRHHKQATKTFKGIDWCRDNMKNKFQDAELQVDVAT